ncbi:MAG: methylmalonyl-CoA epimerase [Flammeovirgaceae bacterium]
MEKIEHIGIAVKNLDQANESFAKLLGKPHYKIEEVESEGVRVSFFDIGGVKVELLEPTHPNSAIAKFLEKKGEGIHHIAFGVTSIDQRIAQASQNGFQTLATGAKDGADNKRIVFLHPKCVNGVLVEMCEEKNS